MKNELLPAIEMRDVADGLWIWRSKITFDCGNETLILDPQALLQERSGGLGAA